MNTMKSNLTAALLCTLVLGIPLMQRAWALPCNNMTPTQGNCNTESKCEGRGAAACLLTSGVYYEAAGGVSEQSRVGSYSIRSTNLLKCTCEWRCKWNPVDMTCSKSAVPVVDANGQVCNTQREYLSQACTSGGH